MKIKTKEKILFKSLKEMPYLCASIGDMGWNETGSWRYIRPQYISQTPSCNYGCPAGEDVEGWIRALGEKRFNDALEKIKLENPFPSITGRVCFHPCEAKCNRKNFGGSISINMLERFVSDRTAPHKPPKLHFNEGGLNVGVVGSGPAGLSCAYHLRRLGHKITVYEKMPELGGMLRYGIPPYRLPRDIINEEIKILQKMGIKFITRSNEPVSKILSLYDAVFIAFGAHKSKRMGVEGENSIGVMSGLEFLRKTFAREEVEIGERVLVIGGGNTAIDTARVSLRKGVKEVIVVYRRSRNEMPAFEEEVAHAKGEGIKFEFLTAPLRVINDKKGIVSGLLCQRMKLGEPDSSGRRRPVSIPHSEFEISCDTIFSAIGEDVDFEGIPQSLSIKDGIVEIQEGGRTNIKNLYAGGDMTSTPRSVADAIASGKKSAIAIDCLWRGIDFKKIEQDITGYSETSVLMEKYLRLLKGEKEPQNVKKDNVEFSQLNLNHFQNLPRVKRAEVSVEERIRDFKEVFNPVSQSVALVEADRCFHCGRCTECDNCYVFCPDNAISYIKGGYIIDYTFCKGCGLCVFECPRSAMEMVEEPTEI